jgi:hypothetical protein
VQVVVALGARVVTGQEMPVSCGPAGLARVSLTVSPASVTLPVLVAAKEYVTVVPAFVTVVGLADLTRVRTGAGAAVTVAVDAGEVTVAPTGVVPETVAELAIEPLSMSAWVAV